MSILLLYSFHCHKEDTYPGNNVLKGKLISHGFCGNYAVQLLEGRMPPGTFNASWKHPYTDIVYTNVFTVSNSCSFSHNRLVQGDIFSFQLDSITDSQNCAVCLMAEPTPPAQDAIKNVQKLN